MITMYVNDGLAIKPDNCTNKGAYDPPIGTVIKFIAEDGSEYYITACSCHGNGCSECVFDHNTGHPLSKLFYDMCGPSRTHLFCYDRTYKSIDTILEEL